MHPGTLAEELERLHPASYAWALGCCRWRRPEAHDVLQASYVKVLSGRARFAGRSSFKTFLFAVIRMTAREHRRRWLLQRLRLLPIEGAASRLEESPREDDRLDAAARSAALRRALRRLARRQREVLELVFLHELTVAEASEVMAVSVGSARVHYHRGKARLRRLLSGGAGGVRDTEGA